MKPEIQIVLKAATCGVVSMWAMFSLDNIFRSPNFEGNRLLCEILLGVVMILGGYVLASLISRKNVSQLTAKTTKLKLRFAIGLWYLIGIIAVGAIIPAR